MTYVLQRVAKQWSRTQIAAYVLTVLRWPGVQGDKPLLEDALRHWGRMPGLSFVDAFLGAVARRDGRQVYTINTRDFLVQGLTLQNPFPDFDGLF
jgi:hypothetical protein